MRYLSVPFTAANRGAPVFRFACRPFPLKPIAVNTRYIIHGADESYYTGKLEAYFRSKAIPYRVEPFSESNIRRCAKATGIVQIPQVECPDGSWLVDTSLIIEHFERTQPEPSISPKNKAIHWLALLMEDYADEWLWRPAMHYRWSYPETARLVSGWLAEHLHERRAPLSLKKQYWRTRQYWVFVRGDGVTRRTRAAVERHYELALEGLQASLEQRPFVLGQRPSEADFGFFASMFRHFFCDPTPARIMRAKAPAVVEWIGRLWNLGPADFENAESISTFPAELAPMLDHVCRTYLPYLSSNTEALADGQQRVCYTADGVDWKEPVKPYRAWCLDRLRGSYQALGPPDKGHVRELLKNANAIDILEAPRNANVAARVPELPIRRPNGDEIVDSWWRTRSKAKN